MNGTQKSKLNLDNKGIHGPTSKHDNSKDKQIALNKIIKDENDKLREKRKLNQDLIVHLRLENAFRAKWKPGDAPDETPSFDGPLPTKRGRNILSGHLIITEWHSTKQDVYHNNQKCTEGNAIEQQYLKAGMGGRSLCPSCERLNNDSRCAKPKSDDIPSSNKKSFDKEEMIQAFEQL